MSRTTVGVRVAVGTVVSLAAVAAVAGSSLVSLPQVTQEPPAVEVVPAAAETLLACDGPILAIGRAAESASEISVAGDPALVTANADGDEPEQEEIAVDGVADATAPLLRQPPDGTAPVAAAGAASVDLDGMDLAGFAASACRAPQMDSWLVGGDTNTGSTGILLLANPGDVNAVVSLEVYGVEGRTVPPGAEAITIPARTQVPIPLAGIAGGETGPVVRVTATGAPVRATLQSSLVRTLDPGGVDLQSAVSPDVSQTIPGLTVTEGAAAAEGSSTGLLRLLATADTGARVTVVSASGDVVRDDEQVQLTADEPMTVDLGALPEGQYAVRVVADEPVVAAAWQTTGFGPGSDYAWYPAAEEISERVLVAVPEGPRPDLHVAAEPGTVVTVEGEDGEQTVTVPDSGYAVTRLDGAGDYTIDPGGKPVHAAIGYTDTGALGGFVLAPDPSAPKAISVWP